MNQYTKNPLTTEQRLLCQVDKTDSCWNWTGGTTPNGYGRLGFKGKRILTHRISFTLFKGEIPDGLFVCHTCDNRRCINPAHLFLGTKGDNARDMVSKGRKPANKHKHKTHCMHGHEFTADNTYFRFQGTQTEPNRQCKACTSNRYFARKETRHANS